MVAFPPRRRSRSPLPCALALTGLLCLTACGQLPTSTAAGTSSVPSSSTTASSTTASSVTPSAGRPGGPVECDYTETGTPARPVSPPPSTGVRMTGTTTAVITMTAGKITITLDRDDAPCTVNSFISLATQKFYDNTSCPRMTVVASLSMLQCGDPTDTRSGGPGYTFPDELSGDETYPAGTVAMANSGPNTNGSQFFLVFKDSQLQPDYTVFGHTDEAGIAVLSKIARGGVDDSNGPGDGRPKSPAKIISVTIR